MKRFFSFFAAILFAGSMMATDHTLKCDLSAVSVSDSKITANDVTWTIATGDKVGSPTITTGTYSGTSGLKFGSSGSNYFKSVSFTTDYFSSYQVLSVKVKALNNGKKTAKLIVSQGTDTIGEVSAEFGQTWTVLTANTAAGRSGDLTIFYEVAQASVFNYFEITYKEEDGVVKTLKSIALSEMTTEFETIDKFVFDGKVTATYSVVKDAVPQEDEVKVVKPTSVSEPDMTTAGEKEVTVSFTDGEVTKEAKYTITVTEHVVTPGTYETAFNSTFFGSTGNTSATQKVNDKDVTFIAKGSRNNDAAHVRFYTGSALDIAVPEGYVLTNIEFTADGTWNGSITSTPTGYDDDTKSWAGEADTVKFTFGAQNRIASVEVTFVKQSAVKVPVITGATTFVDETEVTITCATEEAKIYYTIDGKEPTAASTEYTAAFKLTASATVKAIAIKGEDKSSVVAKSFKQVVFASFEELIAADLASGTEVEVSFEDIEIEKLGSNAIYFLISEVEYEIYYKTKDVPAAWEVGGKVSGTIRGEWKKFSGIWEIVPSSADWKWTDLTYKDAPTALDNTNANVKVEKFFRDGQLIIRKNGVEYNALGTQL